MNIAICDEDDKVREEVKHILEEAFQYAAICEFSSGQGLIEAVQQEYTPDIVLLDIAMEGMDGMETAKKLRELSDVILIFVTGVKEQVFSAFDVGAFHEPDI